MSRRRKRQPTPEEQALWQAVVKDATPLHRDAPPPEAAEDPPATPAQADAPPPVPRAPAAPPPRPPEVTPRPAPLVRVERALPGLRPGDTTGIDRRTADRFRRGRMEIDGRIDLHGMTQEQAHGALTGFIRASAVQGRRCLLVITGKGTRGEGVIRRALPHWLGDAMLRPLILAYVQAQPQHGGQGAFYVLLRRRRD